MRLFASICFLILVTGCSHMRPGNLASVTPVSDRSRAGNVYLLRGWIGIFSSGIDQLTAKINDGGVRANVYQDDQWKSLAAAIKAKYANVHDPEPLEEILERQELSEWDQMHLVVDCEDRAVVIDHVDGIVEARLARRRFDLGGAGRAGDQHGALRQQCGDLRQRLRFLGEEERKRRFRPDQMGRAGEPGRLWSGRTLR